MRKMENVYAWERQCFGSWNVGEEKREREERGRDILGVQKGTEKEKSVLWSQRDIEKQGEMEYRIMRVRGNDLTGE